MPVHVTPQHVLNLTFLPDGRLLAHVWYGRGDLQLCDAREPDAGPGRLPVWLDRQSRMALSADGRRLFGFPSGFVLRAWDLGKPPAMPESWERRPGQRRQYHPHAIAASADRVAAAERSPIGNRCLLIVRDAATGKEVDRAGCDYEEPNRLAFTPDGAHLLLQTGASLAVWDLADTLAKPRTAVNPGRTHILDLAFHPSGRALATVSNDRVVRFWDPASQTVSREFEWNIGKLRAVAFSPDGTRAAIGSHTGRVLLWDVDF
jgi:WD40 repeat protein